MWDTQSRTRELSLQQMHRVPPSQQKEGGHTSRSAVSVAERRVDAIRDDAGIHLCFQPQQESVWARYHAQLL